MRSKTKSFLFQALIALPLTLACLLFSTIEARAQKNSSFVGMLEYRISVKDSALQALYPVTFMTVYTNDTIVRTENTTNQLGKQVVLRHIEKNKSILLLDTPLGKFAIQTDLSKKSDTTVSDRKYTIKKKLFKRKILGKKANRVMVDHPDFGEPIEYLYYKKIDSKYNETFSEIPGLPVRYCIPTADGVLEYELIKMEEYSPHRDLFGVPSEYEQISFDDFLDRMMESQEVPSQE